MSWQDHCAASSTIPQAITCIAVLNGFVTSDHQSLAVLINTSGISRMDKLLVDRNMGSNVINWKNFSYNQKLSFLRVSKILLNKIVLSVETIWCKNAACSDQNHYELIDK